MFLDFETTDRRDCVADAGEKHSQIVVDLSGGSHSASRIAGVDFLLYGYCRRQTFNEIAFRL